MNETELLDPPRPPRKPHMLLWLDTETTGLDPRSCELLEVGMQVTSMDATSEGDSLHLVIHPDNAKSWPSHPELLEAYRMHTANNLMVECCEAPAEGYGYKPTAYNVREFINDQASRYVLHPAGTNVMFDLTMLDRFLSKYLDGPVTEGLSHRHMDLTPYRLQDEYVNHTGYYEHRPESRHRTTWCIQRDITEYRERLNHPEWKKDNHQ